MCCKGNTPQRKPMIMTIGTVLILPEPVTCPEVPYPPRPVHAKHNDTEWTVMAAYEITGYVERNNK